MITTAINRCYQYIPDGDITYAASTPYLKYIYSHVSITNQLLLGGWSELLHLYVMYLEL